MTGTAITRREIDMKYKEAKKIICALPNYMEYQPTKDQDEALDICIELLNKAIEENEEGNCSECGFYVEKDHEYHDGICYLRYCSTYGENSCDNYERKEDTDENLSDNSIQE